MHLIEAPIWYWWIALVLSLWQAFRGLWQYRVDARFQVWRTRDRVIVLYAQATWLWFFSSAVGFVSLLAGCRMVTRVRLESGAAIAAVVALTLGIGVLGVSGELAPLLQRGKFPGVK